MSEKTISPSPMLTERQYRTVKFIAQIFLPALATFYLTIAGLWGLLYAMEISGTITALDLLLGVFLMVDKAKYDASDAGTQGTIDVLRLDDGKKALRMDFSVDPEEFEDRNRVTLKVDNQLDKVYDPEGDTSV